MAGTSPRKSTASKPAKKPRARKPAAKKPATRKRKPKQVEAIRSQPLAKNGMLLISVFGMFNSRALVEMSAERAQALFEEPALGSGLAPTRVIEATAAEIAVLVKRESTLADSAMAASAIALAYEIENPFNSATSKSMCARELRETMAKLRELAPAADEEDGIDELTARRAERRTKPPARRRRAAS